MLSSRQQVRIRIPEPILPSSAIVSQSLLLRRGGIAVCQSKHLNYILSERATRSEISESQAQNPRRYAMQKKKKKFQRQNQNARSTAPLISICNPLSVALQIERVHVAGSSNTSLAVQIHIILALSVHVDNVVDVLEEAMRQGCVRDQLRRSGHDGAVLVDWAVAEEVGKCVRVAVTGDFDSCKAARLVVHDGDLDEGVDGVAGLHSRGRADGGGEDGGGEGESELHFD